MADEDQSIKDQIAAMESWAIIVKQKFDAFTYKDAKNLLKKIDYQGRKIEWRGSGIGKLPDIFTKDLKTQISSARASAEKIINILDKKDFEQKKELYLKLCKQYTDSMTAMLIRAKAVVEKGSWDPVNFPLIKTEKWFVIIFEQFAKRERYYKCYSKDYSLKNIDLSGALLEKADLRRTNLTGANFKGANFKGANFKGANLCDANLEKADLRKAKFKGAKVFGANFSWADVREADYGGDDDLKRRIFIGAALPNAIPILYNSRGRQLR